MKEASITQGAEQGAEIARHLRTQAADVDEYVCLMAGVIGALYGALARELGPELTLAVADRVREAIVQGTTT